MIDKSMADAKRSFPVSGSPAGLWAPQRSDIGPILLILLVPLLVALPDLIGFFFDNPMFFSGDANIQVGQTIIPGHPYIDPNNGITTVALGRASIDLWLHGIIPWWNTYTGVGMPLAGEFQPAAFSPLNLFLLLPHGALLRHLMMQYIAGLGTYFLIQQFGWSRLAGITGALLFAQNGSLAWLAHAPPDPGCFLPWVVLGVERAARRKQSSWLVGWRLFGVATGAMILSGFPETAFICGLFVLVYAIWRLTQCPAGNRFAMLSRVTIGGIVGVALAAPQLIAFIDFVFSADIGGHAGEFANMGLPPGSLIPAFLAPYAYGPIFAYDNLLVADIWGNIGGYCDLVMLALAAAALAGRRDSLTLILTGWIVLCTLKTFAIKPVSEWWNWLPGMNSVAFFRYAPSSVEFAVILLVACAIEELHKAERRRRAMFLGAAITFLVGLVYCLLNLPDLHKQFASRLHIFYWTIFSIGWMTVVCAAAIALIGMNQSRRKAQLLAAVLVIDATFMFALPILSTPRDAKIDLSAISFLQNHLGFQRFYTLGPIAPNYGAYFQIASINHNYLPVPKIWTDYIKQNLDPYANPILFIGLDFVPNVPDALAEFHQHLSAFTQIGVKYLVVPAAVIPFPGPPAYQDPIIKIFELQNPAPYFETSEKSCVLQAKSRNVVVAICPKPTLLLRREMYDPGWHASAGGQSLTVVKAGGLFQSVDLPAGKSRVKFSFAPPYVAWAWCAFWVAILLLSAHVIAKPFRKSRNIHGA